MKMQIHAKPTCILSFNDIAQVLMIEFILFTQYIFHL